MTPPTETGAAVVRVPASSANLGPGFDCFAAALALHLEVGVRHTGHFGVHTRMPVPRGRDNLCVRAFERLHPADEFTFTMDSTIPPAGGMGSSATAIVAGLMAASHLLGLDADVPALATEIEGHPDNVAAAVHGGFVVCADGEVTRLDVPAGLEAVAVVPRDGGSGGEANASQAPDARRHVSTAMARQALPPEVPVGDAVFNIAHGALLTLGLATGDWELVSRGLRDRIHQDRRGGLYPRSHALLDRVSELGALGGTLSGAGPTVLVWCLYEQTGKVVEALRAEVDGWASVMRVPFEPQGAHLAPPQGS